MPFLFTIITLALTIGAVVDIVRREDSQVRFLPRLVWLIVVILLPHIVGAPHAPTPESKVPAELAAHFTSLSLGIQAAL